MSRCSHNFRPCGPGQSMCSKCGLLQNTGTSRWSRATHRHVWHLDKRYKVIVCKTCGAAQ